MHNYREIAPDVYLVGASDRRLRLFENVYPIPDGVSYNAYLCAGKQNILVDTVDKSVEGLFFENLDALLGDKPLHYVIVNHMEPDHSHALTEVVRRYPAVKIVCTAMAANMLKQFFGFDTEVVIVKDKDSLDLGARNFTFFTAPMVHWPEVMVTYDNLGRILYSADAFGTFGASGGGVFADEYEFERDWLKDARRYYTNIVGKYGPQVSALLGKVKDLDIKILAPLHGPVWRSDVNWFVGKYMLWASYTPEESAVLVVYGSIYGGTENAAAILANKLALRGVKNVAVYDASATDVSYLVAEAFRVSHIVFAASTYNAGIFPPVEHFLSELKARNLQNRSVAIIENGSWAPTAGNLMRGILESMKNITVSGAVTISSSVKEKDADALEAIAEAIAPSVAAAKPVIDSAVSKIDPAAMFKLSYGLYVLAAKDGDKDGGCVVNTVIQITDAPKRVLFAVNKANFTHDMIVKTKRFTVSMLTQETLFKTIQNFGFQSGRSAEKWAGQPFARSANGVAYLTEQCNGFISGTVTAEYDYGTHTVFAADVTEAASLSNVPSLTYQYYFDHIKPKPQPAAEKKGWVCKICGYVHEEEDLPEDFVCPLCKHGAADFERA